MFIRLNSFAFIIIPIIYIKITQVKIIHYCYMTLSLYYANELCNLRLWENKIYILQKKYIYMFWNLESFYAFGVSVRGGNHTSDILITCVQK